MAAWIQKLIMISVSTVTSEGVSGLLLEGGGGLQQQMGSFLGF